MLVKIDKDEFYPVYVDWSGYGRPSFEVDIPEELWKSYKEILGNFCEKLAEMEDFLKDY